MGFTSPFLTFLLREFHLVTWLSPQGNEESRSKAPPKDVSCLQMVQDALVSVQLTSKGSHKSDPGHSEMGHLCCSEGLFLTHTTAAHIEMFFCKSHLPTWSLCWTWVTHPPHKAGNSALRRQAGRSRASGTCFSCRRRRSRGPPQCLEGCAFIFVYLVTVIWKQ